MPDGMAYHAIDNMYILNFLCKEYNWDKISLMGHSMGSIVSFMFASVFPNKVDLMIQIDALKPQVRNPTSVAASFEDTMMNFMIADQRNQEKSEPPAYTYDELVERVNSGTFGSVTIESTHYLLKRNVRRSEKFPGKFYFTRDSRLKYSYGNNISQPVSVELAKRLKMPHLFLKAQQSPFRERREYFDEMIGILRENKDFQYHTIDSTHHMHLTEPEKVAPIIAEFIERHQKAKSKL